MASVMQLVNRIRETELPVLTRELRMKRRKKRLIIRALVYGTLALTTVVSIWAAYLYIGYSSTASITGAQYFSQLTFTGISGLLVLAVCVLVPIFSASAVAGERERGSFDLLAITMLSSFSIVAQKLAVSIAVGALVLAASVPTLTVIGLLAELTLFSIVEVVAVILATVCFVAAGGVFWSCMMPNVRAATTATYLSMLGLYVIAPSVWSILLGMIGASYSGTSAEPLIRVIATLVPVIAVVVLAARSAARKTRQPALSRSEISDTIAIVLGLLLLAFLVLRMVPVSGLALLYVPVAVNPLAAIGAVADGAPEAWVSALATLVFTVAGTIVLLRISVRKFDALRRS